MNTVRCRVIEPAFINGALLQVDQEIMLDEKYLVEDKNGKKTLTPKWCIRMEPQEVETIPTISPDKRAESPTSSGNKKDIFATI